MNLLNISAQELNFVNRRLDKIMDFFRENLAEEWELYLKNYYYRDVMTDIMYEFVFGDKKNKNFRYFPWKNEITKRLQEKYGF